MVLERRPHLSERMRAGMVTAKITMAEIPEARKEASAEARPACSKRRGAYYWILEWERRRSRGINAILRLNDGTCLHRGHRQCHSTAALPS